MGHGYSNSKHVNLHRSEVMSPQADLQMSPHKIKKSRNEKFHKVFKNIPYDESVLKCCSCAFFGDILLQGYLYISPNWFCFYTKILGHEKQIEIALVDVVNITRQKTAFIIPNAIGVVTADDKYVFGSLLSRDSTYRLMCSCWKKTLPHIGLDDIKSSSHIGSNESDNIDSSRETIDKPAIEITHTSGAESSEDSHDSLRCGVRSCSRSSEFSLHSSAQMDTPSPASTSTPNGVVPQVQHTWPTHTRTKCFGYDRIPQVVRKVVSQVQSMPWTQLLLIICSFLTLFLFVCALLLAYKIVLLQTAIEQKTAWTNPEHSKRIQTHETYESIYHLNHQYHTASIDKLHSILQANINTLHRVHMSLQKLQTRLSVPESCQKTLSDSVHDVT